MEKKYCEYKMNKDQWICNRKKQEVKKDVEKVVYLPKLLIMGLIKNTWKTPGKLKKKKREKKERKKIKREK